LVLGSSTLATATHGAPPGETIGSDIRRVSDDALALPKAPLRWERTEWVRLGAIAGATAALTLADEDVRDEVLGARGSFTRDLSRVVRGGGDPLGWGGALVATTYVGGLLAGSPAVREAGLEMAEAALFSAVVVGGLKLSVGRSRPDRERGSSSLDPFHGSLDGSRGSFPSQHAAFAFSLASVTAERLPRSGWALYPLAALVALSRVHDDEHWASDVVAGAAIGTAMGLWVAHRPRDGTEASGLTPWATRGAAGLAWVRPF
jgi:membrane-associated phospholipid phosphatase